MKWLKDSRIICAATIVGALCGVITGEVNWATAALAIGAALSRSQAKTETK